MGTLLQLVMQALRSPRCTVVASCLLELLSGLLSLIRVAPGRGLGTAASPNCKVHSISVPPSSLPLGAAVSLCLSRWEKQSLSSVPHSPCYSPAGFLVKGQA